MHIQVTTGYNNKEFCIWKMIIMRNIILGIFFLKMIKLFLGKLISSNTNHYNQRYFYHQSYWKYIQLSRHWSKYN